MLDLWFRLPMLGRITGQDYPKTVLSSPSSLTVAHAQSMCQYVPLPTRSDKVHATRGRTRSCSTSCAYFLRVLSTWPSSMLVASESTPSSALFWPRLLPRLLLASSAPLGCIRAATPSAAAVRCAPAAPLGCSADQDPGVLPVRPGVCTPVTAGMLHACPRAACICMEVVSDRLKEGVPSFSKTQCR